MFFFLNAFPEFFVKSVVSLISLEPAPMQLLHSLNITFNSSSYFSNAPWASESLTKFFIIFLMLMSFRLNIF